MTLTPGTRLGPYEIGSRIGAGGMGEVFRARDTRLERSVAIKILPEEFAANAQLRARFEREAKTISQLNHPNICTLYDVGDNYLVMELVEGESLADRLSRGPLPLPDVLRYGAQIAEALDRAHRAGVVHRDVKPANVMIARDGAKLLDFGLSKSGGSIEVNLHDATQHKPLTEEGTILGTFQYMAPEQLEGAEADARTDIFALGGLLYEMATGQRAFDGKTKTSLIAQIVAASPRPLRELQPLTPPAFEHVVEKCLMKDPEERWQSARDVASELRYTAVSGAMQSASVGATGAPRRRARMVALSALAILTILVLAALAASLRQRAVRADRLVRVDIVPSTPLDRLTEGAAMISPDGTKIVTVNSVSADVASVLEVRDLASGESRVLPGTEDALFPFWSPDGQSVAFFARGKLRTTRVTGGAVQVLADAPEGRGGSWGMQGQIIFTPNIREPLFRIAEGGGTPVRVTQTSAETTHRNPLFLPDGKTFLYVSRNRHAAAENGLFAGSTDGGLRRRVLEGGSNMQYADGYLFYVLSGNLVAQRFDVKSLAVSGAPVPVAESVDYYEPRDLGNFSLSHTGVLLYREHVPVAAQFVWYAADGRNLGVATREDTYQGGVLSRDGRKVATTVGNGSRSDVWVLSLDRPGSTRLTFDSTPLASAAISPDGSKIAIGAGGFNRVSQLWIQDLHGRERLQLTQVGGSPSVDGWSPDGEYVLLTAQRSATRFDVAAVPVRPGRRPISLVATPADERSGAVSGDGGWLAYQSNESGRTEIYVTQFPNPRGKWQVSLDGGVSPHWSADGNTLYFRNGRKILSATRSASGEFGVPAALPIDAQMLPSLSAYGVAPDGRILLLVEAGNQLPTPLRLVMNWRQLLQQ